MEAERLKGNELYLVVVPNQAVGEVWEQQFARWIGPGTVLGPRLLFVPSDTSTFYTHLDRAIVAGVRVFAVTYDAVRLRGSLAVSYKWRGVIADEVHSIGNDSLRYKAMARIPSTWRLGLSGTPYRTRLSQLHRVLDYLQPTLWGNLRGFEEAFVQFKTVGSMKRPKVKEVGGRDSSLLNYWLSRDVMFHRSYNECSPLPKNQTIWLEPVVMNKDEARAYGQIKTGALHQLSTEGFVHLQVKNKMAGAFQLLFAPWQLDSRLTFESSKAGWIAEMLRTGGVDKMLVLTHFAKGIERLVTTLQAESGRVCVSLSGDTSQRDRKILMDRFRASAGLTSGNGGPPVDCLVMNDVGTVGLDFSIADFIVVDGFFSWSAMDLAQAIERGTSMGKSTNTRVAILYAPNSVEEWLYREKLGEQQRLFERVISGELGELSEVLIGSDEAVRAWG